MNANETDMTDAARLTALGSSHFFDGDFEKAYRYADEALPTGGDAPELLRICSLAAMGKYSEAVRLVDSEISRHEKSTPYYQLLLRNGFAANWNVDDYRKAGLMMYAHHGVGDNIYPHIPRWEGQDLAGKTLIVWYAFDGLGDHIMHSRFIPALVAMGATVKVNCPRPLCRLLATIEGVASCHPIDEALPGDYAVRAHHIQIVLGTTANTIPLDPYMSAPPMDFGLGKHVGISWGASWTNAFSDRTCALAELLPVAQIPGITLHSLQKGPHAKQLAGQPQGMQVLDLAPSLGDFLDTASAIAGLDAVVTTDNVVANLSAAMGKATFVLLPNIPDFRWGCGGRVSWYPAARTYQQSVRGEWADPIARLVADLALHVKAE